MRETVELLSENLERVSSLHPRRKGLRWAFFLTAHTEKKDLETIEYSQCIVCHPEIVEDLYRFRVKDKRSRAGLYTFASGDGPAALQTHAKKGHQETFQALMASLPAPAASAKRRRSSVVTIASLKKHFKGSEVRPEKFISI
ncbi:hypothetical protein CYMTET_31691 [Cymbomonas tetramitiformis]|uniref:Uncharacterized protein n=1 Tax=Cymbomonas tetramitiformis TaxID=36881 RepID=A0AAE0FGY9_9CHLO|nr:hypothetical protein CYMTET_31691 [Cymbomonas tetramitiformis]